MAGVMMQVTPQWVKEEIASSKKRTKCSRWVDHKKKDKFLPKLHSSSRFLVFLHALIITNHVVVNGAYCYPGQKMQKVAGWTKSGKCETYISSAADCRTAAIQVNADDQTVLNDNQDGVSYDPKGCYYERGYLKFNSKMTNSGLCNDDDWCLCGPIGIYLV